MLNFPSFLPPRLPRATSRPASTVPTIVLFEQAVTGLAINSIFFSFWAPCLHFWLVRLFFLPFLVNELEVPFPSTTSFYHLILVPAWRVLLLALSSGGPWHHVLFS